MAIDNMNQERKLQIMLNEYPDFYDDKKVDVISITEDESV